MTRRVLVTGSREWTDYDAVADALNLELMVAEFLGEDMVVVHGKARRGADPMADRWARAAGPRVQPEEHPAEWDLYGKSAGHRRNAVMVARGADVCLAFPLGESRGTRGCMKLAEKAGIQVVNHGSEWP
jgi:hypothetical protein